VTIEQGALRLGEAVNLRWGDVDFAGLRLRLARARTKTGQGRFVYLPEWLLQAIDETCPLEDRTPERKVFQGITEASAYQAMVRACQSAGTGISTPMTFATAGSPSGTRTASRPGSSQSGWCGLGVVSRRLLRRGAASFLGAWTSWCSPPPRGA
jgi:integrase